jgi:hypothetical protein
MSSGCDSGEGAIPVIGVKRDRRGKMRSRSRPTELSPIEPVTVNEIGLLAGDFSFCEPSTPSGTGALQDLAGVQVPLLAGVVSLLIGDALQDRFAVFARELVDRGKRVLSSS